MPLRWMPLETYTSAFFSERLESILTAVSREDNCRSVLKMLNSVSSAVKAAPVSSALSSLTELAISLASPSTSPLMILLSASRSSVKSWSTLNWPA